MESISVECRSRKYDVIVGQTLEDLLFETVGERKTLVVTDNEVEDIYGERISQMLPQADMFVIKSGERSKSENTLFDLIEYLLDNDYDRRSLLVAFGGGVVGDLTGFAASIFMRGIDYIQVPTTLLAQVDSSVGGKTAINYGGVKNVVGSFYQPRTVICDTDYLATLDEREVKSGIGEIVKTAGLDEKLFDYVERNLDSLLKLDKEVTEEAIVACIKIKAEIVGDDERDRKSIRNRLNLGHTLGHAIEISSRAFPRSHGECVLIGTYFEAEIAAKLNRIDLSYKARLQKLIVRALGEEPELISTDKIISTALKDKKNRDGLISVIIPVGVGDVDEVFLREDELEELLDEIHDEKDD